MAARNVLKMDKDSISEFQKDMYNGTKDAPDIGTRYSLDFEKRAQSNHIKVKLDQVAGKEGEIIYTVSKKFDVLFGLSAFVKLFPIRVKDAYTNSISICYHHNLGHNIFPSGECKIDDDHFAFIDSIWMDCYSETFEEKRELYNRMIGKLPFLEEWTTELPSLPLVIPQIFSFTRASQVGLPIWKSTNNKITFEYKIRTKLIDLLRMRVLKKDGSYKEIKCNLKYLDYKSESLPAPEMWGRYGDMSDEERNWRKSIDENTGLPIRQVLYVEDIDIKSSENPITLGKKDVIKLESLSPVKHIMWVASLVDGNLSNYTTNREDVYKGWNPCAVSNIKYGNSNRTEELGYEHYELSEYYDFDWGGTPKEAGYNIFTYSFNPTDLQHADNAVILGNCGATLIVTLGDTDPFVSVKEKEEYTDEKGELIPAEALDLNTDESNKDKYIIHVRTVILRKLEVYWDSRQDAIKYEFIEDRKIKRSN